MAQNWTNSKDSEKADTVTGRCGARPRYTVSYLVLWAQSATEDYIRADKVPGGIVQKKKN